MPALAYTPWRKYRAEVVTPKRTKKRTLEGAKNFTEHDRNLDYIDVFSPMLGKDGKPRAELFVEDRLHLNGAGYRLWRSIVAPFVE